MPETENEKGWLDEDGICFFPGPEARLPSDLRIASPDIGILDLITGLLIKNPSGAGIVTVQYNSIKNEKDPLPSKIFGVVIDSKLVKQMMAEDPDWISLKDPNNLTWMNLDQWHEKFGTNGLALIAKMRLFWNAHGGGVVIKKPQGTSEKVFKKLGKY